MLVLEQTRTKGLNELTMNNYSLWVAMLSMLLMGYGCTPSSILHSPSANLKQASSGNTPVLTWEPQQADSIEVVLDGRSCAVLPGKAKHYRPFPMAFGKHEWYLKIHRGGESMRTQPSEFVIHDDPLASLPERALLLREGWWMQSSLLTDYDGKATQPKTLNWYPATIPTTVLTTLVRNHQYPDPYIGMNNLKIPDANDAFNEEHGLLKYSHIPGQNPFKDPYWFYTSFSLTNKQADQTTWLHFNEINYAAEVWVNGYLVADSTVMKGMERRFRFDVSAYVTSASRNELAVKIYPPDHVGKPSPPPTTPLAHPGRNMGAIPDIAKDYTKWDVLGWDWQPGVRDRDMGITEDVYLSFTGEAIMVDPYISADLPLPDTSQADLTLSLEIHHAAETQKRGVLIGKISAIGQKQSFDFTQEVTLPPGTSSFTFTKGDIPDFALSNPYLWWPIHYGQPHLYQLELSLKVDGKETDATSLRFGIRETETYIGPVERVYKLNGKRIYPRGGNWVIDMLLTWNKTRYEQEIAFSALANMNIQRVWGPTGVPPECFFDAADEQGIMIWQDFLNDFWGTQKHDPAYIPSETLYRAASIDVIKKLRNHPSVVIWCGGNEGPNPREALIMEELLPTYDPRGGRHYLKNSLGDGLHGSGPYHTIRPKEYYQHERLYGFSSELGPSGFPTEESLYRFLPALGQEWETGYFPIDGTWAYHDANNRVAPDQRQYTYYDTLVRYDYDLVASTDSAAIADYASKAQLVNFETYRSVIERINHQLWDSTSGYAIWKYNSSWPSLVWQLYDWYQIPNAGLYATRQANRPIHLQLNRLNHTVAVVNTTFVPQNWVIKTQLMKPDLSQVWEKTAPVELPENSVYNSDWQVPIEDDQQLYFVAMQLLDQQGREVCRNLYWVNESNDYKALNQLPEAKIELSELNFDKKGELTFRVSNPGNQLAFFTHFQLIDTDTQEEILPTFWEDNYVSLLPQQSLVMTVRFDPNDLRGKPVLTYEGHNIQKSMIEIK